MMIMMFVGNLDSNKVIDNLLILLVLNFHGNRLSYSCWKLVIRNACSLEILGRSGRLLCLT
jgi:hypothetical protein